MASKETPMHIGVSLRFKVGETPIDTVCSVKRRSLQKYNKILFSFSMASCFSVNGSGEGSKYSCS